MRIVADKGQDAVDEMRVTCDWLEESLKVGQVKKGIVVDARNVRHVCSSGPPPPTKSLLHRDVAMAILNSWKKNKVAVLHTLRQ